MQTHSPDIPVTLEPGAEVDRLGDEIAELSAHIEAATARLLDLIRKFDARRGWNTGFRSCAAWLSWRVGLDLGAAREKVRVARALGTLPLLAQALGRGELSYAKVRALTWVATAETEERLLAVGRAGTAAHVERIVRGWRRVDRHAEARESARQHASRALHVYEDEDGTVVVRGRLTPEVGALLLRALAAARETLYQQPRGEQTATRAVDASADTPTVAQQQADALALLAETALHHELDPGAPGERYQVVVHVDAAALADPDQPGQSALEGGVRVSPETSRRLACDASRVVMRRDEDGRVVEVGARTRTIPTALRRALHHRDRGCRFPGCGLRFGEGHHVRHWAEGGPTTLSNLALLCRRHHRAVHEEGYRIDQQLDGALRFRRPDGRPLPEVPPPSAVPADPVEALRARHKGQGLRLHARTACAGWLGERLDVGWAIDVLHPLAARGVGNGMLGELERMGEIRIRSSLVVVLAVLVTAAGCGWCPVDGRESSGDKHEWSILQDLEARSRFDSATRPLEPRTIEGYEVVAVPGESSEGRIWIMLAPQSPLFYKQMPAAPYVLDRKQVDELLRRHKVSSTVQEVLWSHVREVK